MSYDAPQSRNEAILQNILGANNVLVDPQSRIEAILQAILYDEIYDEEAMSRMEELLLAIKNNGTWNHEPISRNEEILYAKLNGETYDKEPQSRIEALLIDWCNQSPITVVTDTAPYLFRQSGGDNNAYVGTEETDKLVGASAVVNQMVDIPSSDISKTQNRVTFTDNRDGSYSVITDNGGATSQTSLNVGSIKFELNHKYFGFGSPSNSTNDNFFIYTGNSFTADGKVVNENTGTIRSVRIVVKDGVEISTAIKFKPQFIDLTAMFGTVIADYVYSLEQATAGSGIAYLRKYGFFTKDYYPYKANTLQSVNTSKHVMRDAQDNIIGEYALPNIDLRGLYKLDASNNLYADGDTLEGDGTLTRKYEQRLYQSGDESLADAITDGTNTVVKLVTPTTETATGFTNPQAVDKYGTEEYVDARDFPMPVGHETDYPSR